VRVDRRAFVLDEQLCFALHAASRAMTGCFRPLLDELGITYTQYAVLLVLWEHESVTLGFLCTQVQLDTGTLSPLLKRLEAQGLVTRRRRAEDERTVQLTITEAGRALRDRAAAAAARVEDTAALPEHELVAMRDALRALAARLRGSPALPAVESALPAVESALPAVESALPAVESALPAALPAAESAIHATSPPRPVTVDALPDLAPDPAEPDRATA
jgi:MarR family transcriptional regulator, organic hydroperoxide resistance regulator